MTQSKRGENVCYIEFDLFGVHRLKGLNSHFLELFSYFFCICYNTNGVYYPVIMYYTRFLFFVKDNILKPITHIFPSFPQMYDILRDTQQHSILHIINLKI